MNGRCPFFIRQDVWRRTLPKAFNFYPSKRCGVALPNVHPACHLDDARRRDTGEYIDMTGGWHDAGDLRKWMVSALLSGTALSNMVRNLGESWNLDGAGLKPRPRRDQVGQSLLAQNAGRRRPGLQ